MPADTVEGLLRQLAPQVLGALVRRYGHFDEAEWQTTRTHLLDSPARHDAVAAASARHGVTRP